MRVCPKSVEPVRHRERRLRIVLAAPPYFDVPPAAYGGVEAVVADLADALVARGHEVTLLAAGRPGTAARFMPLWDRAVPELLGEPVAEVAHTMKVRRMIERIAASDGVDVVHDHTLAGPLNAAIYRQLGLATVVTVHNGVDADLHGYYRNLGDEVNLVAISDRQRDLAPDLNWVGRVYDGLHVDDWPFRAHKQDYALFLGRFSPDKAPHLALRAAHEAGIPLVLAGRCAEPSEKTYFDEILQPMLGANDHVVGQVDAIAKRRLLAEARCLLFPVQWEEPFGMVMIEAMVCGTPVVALHHGAVPEIVVDGVTGFICEDPDDLATAIHRTPTLDPAACRQHVRAHFSAEHLGSEYERIYRKVLCAASRPFEAVSDQPVRPGSDRGVDGSAGVRA